MKILAIDTATEACSVALLNGEESSNIFEICPQQQSQQILPMIDKLLRQHNIKVHELDAIAYGRGPGSFTGVRIAASTVQGLALGANLPVLEVSTMAAMAQQNYMQHQLCETVVMIDARMQEVYLGHYKIVAGIACEVEKEQVLAPNDALQFYLDKAPAAAIAGTGYMAYEDVFTTQLQNQQLRVNYPNALFILPIAAKAFAQGKSVMVEDIQPIYVRDKVTWKKLPHKV